MYLYYGCLGLLRYNSIVSCEEFRIPLAGLGIPCENNQIAVRFIRNLIVGSCLPDERKKIFKSMLLRVGSLSDCGDGLMLRDLKSLNLAKGSLPFVGFHY